MTHNTRGRVMSVEALIGVCIFEMNFIYIFFLLYKNERPFTKSVLFKNLSSESELDSSLHYIVLTVQFDSVKQLVDTTYGPLFDFSFLYCLEEKGMQDIFTKYEGY